MDITFLHSIWTVISVIVFVGIIIWALSGKRKQEFDYMAQLPLESEDHIAPVASTAHSDRGA